MPLKPHCCYTYVDIFLMLWFSSCWSRLNNFRRKLNTIFFALISCNCCSLVSPPWLVWADWSISFRISSMYRIMELSSPWTVPKRSPSMLMTGSRLAEVMRKKNQYKKTGIVNWYYLNWIFCQILFFTFFWWHNKIIKCALQK